MLIGVLAATSMFWKFWELDRSVSLSPLETGAALATALPRSMIGKELEIGELLSRLDDEQVNV